MIQKSLFENTQFDLPQMPALRICDVVCSCGFSDESPKALFSIKEIDKKLANKIQIENHYLHTKASCVHGFGLFYEDKIIGVILYGNPTAPTTIDICGGQERKNVIEITRLWIADGTPKNTESYFIGNTIKMVDKEIIVAFADPEYNHIGTVYQASNFIFTGKSDRGGRVIAIKNNNIHNKTLWKQYKTASKIREVFGEENVYYKPYITKLRYVYLNCKPKRKKELLEKLKYEILPYPKLSIDVGL